ncbi:hypothetical protein AMTRI_Chr07g82090 [Amborella trichopoda]
MADQAMSLEELPSHLLQEILNSGRLGPADLACLEASCRIFRGHQSLFPFKFRSMAEFAAFHLCSSGAIFRGMSVAARTSLVDRCGGNWKLVLRFIQSVEQASSLVETPSGNVFTCGDNSSICCGHGEVRNAIFRPTQVVALKGIPCKEVATGLNFTVVLTREGHVYTFGSNIHGQLGHGDILDRPTPKLIESFGNLGRVVQVAAGASYTLAVTEDGTLYSFGYGANFCLGHGDQHNELQPRALHWFKRRNVHILRVSAGDEHAVALDSSGYVYTWGKGYCGALGHGDENDKTTPELLTSLRAHRAVQVCARKRKTFVLLDDGSVFAFGWMGFGSLGFSDRSSSDKIMKPRVLKTLRGHHISQISTGLYHTVVVTNRGLILGFGDNERAQLGQEFLRGCLEPMEIKRVDQADVLGIQ